jgi:MoxR-like ATPase
VSALAGLRAALETAAIGQAQAKRALLIGLIARQHVYLEGPPGAGKSQLARVLAEASGARLAEPVLHRDLRAEDLLGDPVLERSAHGSGERLRIARHPGELAGAQLWLLDGISRAPGAALAPLLHALDSRRAAGRALPLECAIATAGLPGQELHGEPLEPAALDRFALQVRVSGLIASGDSAGMRALLDRSDARAPALPRLDPGARAALQRAAAALPLPPEVERAWLELLADLGAGLGPGDAARLSDRALLAAAPSLLRAHACLRGAARVEREDLALAQLVLARRLPAERSARLQEAVADLQRDPRTRPGPAAAPGAGAAPGEGRGAALEGVPGSAAARRTGTLPRERAIPAADAEIRPLLRALEGQWSRGCAGRRDDPAGAPRGQRRLRALDEALDADPVETWLFAEGRWPGAPHAWRRQRRGGGALALLRDVSASMEGRLGVWTGEIVAGLVRSARRSGLRVGYVEFDHEAVAFRQGGRFFQRRCAGLLAAAARRRAAGGTSYEAPLRAALDEFRRVSDRARHAVLLTDGLPVAGDPEVRAERALARRLGVRVHTVFVGLGECPAVLDRLSAETGGAGFRARAGPGGRIRLEPRDFRVELERCMNV